ncbi:MAG: InlB B-repeat-containing protein [Acutalibacteraceae bacterium]|nr:InlB B-repeat-containing protein [Acutalibacteraceae bacterium]
MSMTRKNINRFLGLLMCLCLLIGALYVPVSMSAFAQSQTTVYDFSYCVDATANKKAAEENGVGYYGWGFNALNQMLGGVQLSASKDWAESGGYRVHNAEGLCTLDTSSTYIVSMKIKVVQGVKQTGRMHGGEEASASLGWGCSFDSTAIGQENNYINGMSNKVINIFSSSCGSETYRLNTGAGEMDATYSDEWKTVTYELKTPADFGGKDNTLSIWIQKWYGIECYIDDLSVTKLGANQGVVVEFDEYSGIGNIHIGNIGDTVTLSDISDRAKQADHTFKGWFKDAERTEQVTEMTITAEKQTVYSDWNAPVVYTFKNTLTGEDIIVNGNPGEAIEYPADPVDENGEQWFMGWYTTQACTVEFTEKNFSYVNKSIYSLFKSEIPELKQDFENYNKEVWTPSTNANTGRVTKSNRLYFADMMQKQSLVTYNDSGYAVKFDWDSSMEVVKEDPNTYGTATRYNQMDMYFWLGKGLDDKTEYVVTFKYKVEKTDADLIFYAASAIDNNIWGNYQVYNGVTVKNADLKNEWQEISFPITTAYKNAGANTMYLGVKLSKNTDTVVYFDDVEIKALMQPYQSKVVISDGVNAEYELIGRRGEAIVLETPVHPKGVVFKGWYLDEKYTTPAENIVYERVPYTVYAKWDAVPLTFNDYPYSTNKDNCGFGKLLSIDKSGLGVDGDAAVRFDFKGSYVYKVDAATGEQALYNTRTTTPDHTFVIKRDVKNNTVYKISYKYKVLDANTSVSIIPYSGYYANIWVPKTATKYEGATNTVKLGEATDWQTHECYITTNLLTNDKGEKASALFLVFNVGSGDVNAMVDVLVDDVLVEAVEPPYAMFNMQNGKPDVFVAGEVGEKINYPDSPTAFGKTFKGWYADKECTVPFTTTTFTEGMTAVVYAGYTLASEFTYDFEKYDFLPKQLTPGAYYMEDAFWKTSKYAKSGSGVIEFDRTVPFNVGGGSYATVANGSEQFKVDKNRQYVITFSYCVTKKATAGFSMQFVTARDINCWDNTVVVTPSLSFNVTDQKVGVWYTKTLALDLSSTKYDTIFFRLKGGADGIFLLDDVTVTVVPEGYGAIAFDTGGSKDVPNVLTGKIGDSYANRLPKEPKVEGKYFKGYYEKDTQGVYNELKEDVMKFGESAKTVFARFLDYKVIQDFEGTFVDATKVYTGLNIFDFDYELYDATAEGNSKDNVTSGKYSLHRKGTSRYFESSAVLTPDNHVAEGSRYKVSFKVKMGKHLHTDGAIKIASSRNQNYSWDTTGDWYPVVALKDLADGEWHEVSYIYNSVESFFAIQTPGYAELFIDDVVFELITDDTPVSTPIEFTEYVPLRRDENGNITEITAGEIDVNSIVDASLKLPGQSGLNITVIIIIATAGALVVAGAVILLVVLKKKKVKKA